MRENADSWWDGSSLHDPFHSQSIRRTARRIGPCQIESPFDAPPANCGNELMTALDSTLSPAREAGVVYTNP